MSKYIDAGKLKAEIERRNLSNRYITTEGYEEELYEIIDSLQQEQPEVDLEKEIDDYLYSIEVWEVEEEPYRQLDKCARHFYELGQQEIRHRIMNPEYNAKVVEQLKSEHPTIKEEQT